MNKRLIQLINYLQEQHIDAAWISSTANVFYFTNFYCDPHERLLSLFVFSNGEIKLICPKMEEQRAKASFTDGEVIGYTDTDDPFFLLTQSIQKTGLSTNKMAIEKEHLSFERYEKWNHFIHETSFCSITEICQQLRMVKDAEEIKKMQVAATLADEAIEIGIDALKEGKTELEIIATIEFEMKKKGVESMSFPTMVLFGENSANPHGIPGTTTLQKGDFVLFDLGVVVDGYCSDITRTIGFHHVNEQQKEIYQIVQTANECAITYANVGTKINKLDWMARSWIKENGYGDYFPHRLGHGIGIDLHEAPFVTETNVSTIQNQMTFTIEPGIYLPNVGGVRIEDDVLVTETGAKTLTSFPKHLIIK